MASVATAPGQIGTATSTVQATVRAPWFRKLAASVGVLLLSSLFIPAVLSKAGRVVQDRQRERELKATLSEAIVQPVTAAVTRAGLFAAGLMPTVATAAGGSVTYATVLEEWLAAGSKAGAQIDTYVGEGDGTNRLIHKEWKPLFDAVTDYLRVSSNIEQLDRPKAVERIRKNLGASNTTQANQVDWKSLLGPRTAGDYYNKFRDLGDELLAARDTMLLHLRAAHLPGFSHGLFEF